VSAEFLAHVAAAGLLWATAFPADGRPTRDDVLAAMPVALAPMMAFDVAALVVSVPSCARQWDWLLWRERWSRLLHLHGISCRLLCITTLCFLALPGGAVLLPFFLSWAGQLLMNMASLRDKGIFARIMLLDGGICVIATQVFLKLYSIIRWSWAWVMWPLWLFITFATAISVFAAAASSRPHRFFWVVSTAVFVLFGFGLSNAGRHMDGEDVEPWTFFVPLLVSSGLVFLAAVCASIGFAAGESLCHSDTVTDGAAARRNEWHDGPNDDDAKACRMRPALPVGSTVPLQVISSTYFRSLELLPPHLEVACENSYPSSSCHSAAVAVSESGWEARQGMQPRSLPLCCVCVENEADGVIVDCGHGGLCHVCAVLTVKRFGDCCFCRTTAWQGVARLELEREGKHHGGLLQGAVVTARVLNTC